MVLSRWLIALQYRGTQFGLSFLQGLLSPNAACFSLDAWRTIRDKKADELTDSLADKEHGYPIGGDVPSPLFGQGLPSHRRDSVAASPTEGP